MAATVPWAAQSVTRLRASSAVDEYGNAVLDWSTPDELVLDGVSVQPLDAVEQQDPARDAVMVRFLLIGDPMDVGVGDRVRYGGSVYDVAGEPLRFRDGILDHDEIRLSDVRG